MSEDGAWTIRVQGGPAFPTNCVAALEAAARMYPDGPRRDCLVRLAAACESAER